MVVLDVNVFLDVAELVGEPFSWERFDEVQSSIQPHQRGAQSFRVIAGLRTGQRPDGRRVELWTSDHIDRLVALKAYHPRDADDERDRGLGWSRDGAQSLIDVLIADLVQWTGGGTVGDVAISYGTPPLSHEDGCVYATARDAGHADVYAERYCLTRDNHFLHARLPGLIDVQHPRDWMVDNDAMARAAALRKMLNGS
ncbi:hypothetical protein [Microbacterium binotii]|uniref:hypothetical protein n=1 Tax=Microbacterium binotii TaxID=462710 RepID=UPI001F2893BB|nr:hypothetical protein [Microbacterium binotii]UIN30936.1 hypothetical protein LXM64_01635 [Microbacterium binotii]